ncbi:MAG: RNA 2',3'-cyclic phosphodiesterase [Dongiaceae bacterium]
MVRLFVGLRFPFLVQEQLHSIANGLPGATWLPPENYHLTLRFIGEVDNGKAEDIDTMLLQIQAPAFELILRGVAQFGPLESAHSVWASVERSDALYHLRDKVESAVVRAGAEPDHRRFTPHVTLGRLKYSPPDRLEQYLSYHQGFKTPPVPVNDFVLYSSHLGSKGASYEQLAVYPLQKP